ncbi:hypothetical protein RvY_01257-2 [Ramazzottius varieornatus]|uniref:Uncharacterized protein n=1 Tax=Ramazzottius varieornatus TaxID=947166 RepID=A0A1D1UFM7_RAMVA|nr:hypothetical protein RvY_01257-2 [Ramazzottius varieornatus]
MLMRNGSMHGPVGVQSHQLVFNRPLWVDKNVNEICLGSYVILRIPVAAEQVHQKGSVEYLAFRLQSGPSHSHICAARDASSYLPNAGVRQFVKSKTQNGNYFSPGYAEFRPADALSQLVTCIPEDIGCDRPNASPSPPKTSFFASIPCSMATTVVFCLGLRVPE